MAERKRDTLQQLYAHDARVTPWVGTAHGVLPAVNTYRHHHGVVRGDRRAERNQLKTLTGEFAQLDGTTWQTLIGVLRADAWPSGRQFRPVCSPPLLQTGPGSSCAFWG